MGRNKRIKEALKSKGITQMQLAKFMLELDKKALSPNPNKQYILIKAGQAKISHQLTKSKDTDSIELLIAVAEITGYHLSWLILGTGPQIPEKMTKEEWQDVTTSPEESVEDFDENEYQADLQKLMGKSLYNLEQRYNKKFEALEKSILKKVFQKKDQPKDK